MLVIRRQFLVEAWFPARKWMSRRNLAEVNTITWFSKTKRCCWSQFRRTNQVTWQTASLVRLGRWPSTAHICCSSSARLLCLLMAFHSKNASETSIPTKFNFFAELPTGKVILSQPQNLQISWWTPRSDMINQRTVFKVTRKLWGLFSFA